MKILVTGGGGFLGLYLIKSLIAAGHEVFSFSRNHHPELNNIHVKHICGNLTDEKSVIDAMEEIEACFHVASKVSMWGKWSDFYQTNVLGTKNIIHACHTHCVKYLIYTSSPSAVFGKDSISGANESLPYPSTTYGLYGKSKAMAEQLIIAANNEKMRTVALRPHIIFGPGDQNIVPGLLKAADQKRLKIVGDGNNKVDVIYVQNAVDAHLCALNKLTESNSIGGKCFFIGQGPIMLWEFINLILEHKGRQSITQKISFKKAFLIGFFIEKFLLIFRVFNVKPAMTRFIALQLSKDHYFDHHNAHNLLGWKPKVSIHDAIKRL